MSSSVCDAATGIGPCHVPSPPMCASPVEMGVVDAVRVVPDDVAAVVEPAVRADPHLKLDVAVPVGEPLQARPPPLLLLGRGRALRAWPTPLGIAVSTAAPVPDSSGEPGGDLAARVESLAAQLLSLSGGMTDLESGINYRLCL